MKLIYLITFFLFSSFGLLASAPAGAQAPSGWICDASLYDDGVCDCGCDVKDSDCPASGTFEICERSGCSVGQVPWEHQPETCMQSACGDGWRDQNLGEACDDGNALNRGGCNADCSAVNLTWVCGDRAEGCQRQLPDSGVVFDSGVLIDAGASMSDSGATIDDTGVSTPDTGVSDPDTGVSNPDTGLSNLDAAVGSVEAGLDIRDAGLTADTGSTISETSDAGRSPSRAEPAADSTSSGSSCSSVATSDVSILLLLAAALFGELRRRKYGLSTKKNRC